MKIKLIEDWCLAHKMWSVRLNALGSMLLGWILIVPEQALALWQFVPHEARQALPPRIIMVVPLLLFVAANVARIVKQEKLNAANRK